jgi:hypothetical protein
LESGKLNRHPNKIWFSMQLIDEILNHWPESQELGIPEIFVLFCSTK